MLKPINRNYYADCIQRWTVANAPAGRYYGYPECCIKAFCEQPPELLERMTVTPSDQMRFEAAKINGKFSGFIPCHDHAKQILNGEIALPDLIKNRNARLPKFPYA